MDEESKSEPATFIRWKLVLPFLAAGIAMSLFGIVMGGRATLNPAWSNLLLDYGATTVLGVALFLVQRNFVKVVSRRQDVLSEEIGEVRDNVDERFVAQESTLRRLNDRVSALTDKRHSAEDATIAEITNGSRIDALKNAIEMARDRNLIHDSFRVRIDEELDGLRFQATPLLFHDRLDAPTPKMSLTVSKRNGACASVLVDVDETIEGVLSKLVGEMERHGLAAEASDFDAQGIIETVQGSLRLVLDARRGMRPGYSGMLIELYDDDLAITTEGIESLSKGTVVAASEFPSTVQRFRDPNALERAMPVAGPRFLSH